jgi:SAM-dependent methyltransferase
VSPLQSLRRWGLRRLFGALARRAAPAGLVFLNHGWAELEALGGRRDPYGSTVGEAVALRNHFGSQLYRRVVGSTPLDNLRVLDVSSGHGGGAAYLKRTFGPRSVVGVDRNRVAIRFSRSRCGGEGVEFRVGDALALPFEADEFDVVVSVEASHQYDNLDCFVGEAARVLRPGGVLVLGDFRFAWQCEEMDRSLRASELRVTEHEEITAGVVRAMERTSEATKKLVDELAPRFVRRDILEFAGVKGSRVHAGLVARDIIYCRYVLRKPDPSSPCQ